MFEKTLYAGWGDMDFNGHMKNTAYSDKSGDVRMMFFADNGFPMSEFMRRKLGPVVMRDTQEYFKEVHLLDEIRVTLTLAGLAEDGSRFLMVNEFFRPDGMLAVRVSSAGGWLNLSERKLCEPPTALLNALQTLPKTEEFTLLPSSVRRA